MNSLKFVSLASNARFRQFSLKQFMPQPHTIRVDHITLAISGNFVDPTVAMILLDLAAVHSIGLPRQSHYTANLVQTRLCSRDKRGQYVAKIDSIISEAMKIATR